MKRLVLTLIAASMIFVSSTTVSQGQDRRSELGEQQKLVVRKMEELESQIKSIAEKIAAKGDKERADRLILALNKSKEQLLTVRMKKVTDMLNNRQYDAAKAELEAIVVTIEELVRLLLNEKREKMTRKEEIDKLEKWKKEINNILKEQVQHTRENKKYSNKDKTLQDLDEKIAGVKNLIKDQKQVIDQTDKNAEKGVRALDRVADKQYETRKKTEDLADRIGNPDGKPKDGKPSDGKGKDGKPSDGKPSDGKGKDGKGKDGKGKDGKGKDGKGKDGKPSDGKGKDGKGKDGKSSDGKSSDGKSSDGKSSDGKSSDGKSSDGKSSSGKSSSGKSSKSGKSGKQGNQNQPKQPGQQPLEQAAKNQQKAENDLAKGKPAEAKRNEQKALKDLNDALNELEKERRRIASLPPEVFKDLAKKQRRTRGKTEDLAKEMAKAKKPSGDQANDQNGKQPGQKSVQQAQKNMQQAAQDLEQSESDSAQRKQKQSERDLKQALEEIEERLRQLREETREEKLARLEARFREMLNRQKVVSATTIELNDKKTSFGRLRPRDVLTLLRMSTEEMEIRELGQQAYDLLIEDGTSIVFPEIVQDVREDLATVAQLLQTERTDQLTQIIQVDIESTLQELLDALKQAQKQGKQGGQGGQSGGGKQPLLKKSAEYKILYAAESRVYRRTRQLEIIRGDKPLDAQLAKEIQNIAKRQKDVADMTERVMENQ